jgi:hypothetical protein
MAQRWLRIRCDAKEALLRRDLLYAGHLFAREARRPGDRITSATHKGQPLVRRGLHPICGNQAATRLPGLRPEAVALWAVQLIAERQYALLGVVTTSRPVRAKRARERPRPGEPGVGIDRVSRLNPAGALRAALTPFGWVAI